MAYYVHCIRYHMCSQSHRDGYDVKEYAAGEPIPLGQTHSSPNPRNSWTSSVQGPFNTRGRGRGSRRRVSRGKPQGIAARPQAGDALTRNTRLEQRLEKLALHQAAACSFGGARRRTWKS